MSVVVSLFLCSYAQPYSSPISLQERVNNSDFVLEGKVVSKFSFWNDKHTNIYTSNTLDIYKIFKGNLNPSEVALITKGGLVGTELEIVTDALELNVGDIGIFFCKFLNNGATEGEGVTLKPFGDEQGFIRYDLKKDVAMDGFRSYKHITNSLYSEIIKITGEDYREIKALYSSSLSRYSALSTLTITSFEPSSVPAGTAHKLTIYGSGFGSSQGSGVVWFRNADNGGWSLIAHGVGSPAYRSWTDTEIILYLPDNAGTGPIEVENDMGQRAESAMTLDVPFAISEPIYYAGEARTPLVGNYNGNGGYTFWMNTEFYADSGARNTALAAISKFICETGVNWESGETTTVNASIRDGINALRFSTSGELGSGTLGRTSTYYSTNMYGTRSYLEEIDIVFNIDTNWYFGDGNPPSTLYDFQSVVLHELGHAILLGHVNDYNDLMYYAIGRGEIKRELNKNLKDGVDYVLDYSEANLTLSMIRARMVACPSLEDVIVLLQLLTGLDVDNPCPFQDYDCEKGLGLKEAAYMLQKVSGLRE